ncbi:hypothetical protein BS78_01G496000 [Paspalum vaginatum]|nr:hypothetical protein BS78_01G496000 [Paspalum vaginatum]
MAAIPAHLTATLPFLPTLRPCPRRLRLNAFGASVAPHQTAGVALRGCRHCNPSARSFHGFDNAISLWTEHKGQPLFASASGRDSPSTGAKRTGSGDSSSSPDGPPVLTILAGLIVFLLVLWVIGSVITWIVGLAFGGAKP